MVDFFKKRIPEANSMYPNVKQGPLMASCAELSEEDRAMLDILKGQVAVANIMYLDAKLSALMRGGISVVDHENDAVICMPERMERKYISAEQMLVFSLSDGKRLEGTGQAPRDLEILLAVYRGNPEIRWIAHIYTKWAMTFSQAGRAIPVYNTFHAGHFGEIIECSRALTPEEIRKGFVTGSAGAIAETLQKQPTGERGSVLIRNDGALVWGPTFGITLNKAGILEKIASFAWNVEQLNHGCSTQIPEACVPLLCEESFYAPLKEGYCGIPGNPVTIQEQRRINLDLLIIFDKFCRSHDIKYSLTGGTLLGAVRHGGFIPWDDDVDIFMTRPEYEKLAESYPDDGRYQLFNRKRDPEFNYVFGRLIDTKTIITASPNTVSFGKGMFLDICIVDGLPKKKLLRKIHIIYMRVLVRARRATIHGIPKRNPQLKLKQRIKKSILLFGKTIVKRFTTFQFWNRRLEKAMDRYSFDSSEFVGNFTSQYGKRELLHKAVFDSYIDMAFEGHKFMVCVGYEEYLHNIYRNYMALPALAKRKGHHPNTAYWVE